MAQNYPGSNNLSLFHPHNRRGKYVFAQLSWFTVNLFSPSDEPLREYLKRDAGKSIEHLTQCFMPIIPMILVNGIQAGMGAIYNPRDIIANLRRLANHRQLEPMVPWYRWFKGKIKKDTETSYTTIGVVDVKEGRPDTLIITELPIGTSVEGYTKFLEAARDNKEPIIQKYIRYYDGYKDIFEVVMSSDQMELAQKEGFEIKLNLTTRIDTSNMYLLDKNGVKMKYDTPEEILMQFYRLRLKCYEERKWALVDDIDKALLQLEDQCRFIREYLEGKIDLGKKQEELYADLKADKGYKALPKEPSFEDYAYLLSMNFYTAEYENQLRVERDRKIELRDSIVATSPEGLWLQDLCVLELRLKHIDAGKDHLRKICLRVGDSENEEVEDLLLKVHASSEEESSEEDEDEAEMAFEFPPASDKEDEGEMVMECPPLSATEIEKEEPAAYDFSEFISSSLEQDKEDEATGNKKKILVQEDKEGETEMTSKRRRTTSSIDGDDDDEEEGRDDLINCGSEFRSSSTLEDVV